MQSEDKIIYGPKPDGGLSFNSIGSFFVSSLRKFNDKEFLVFPEQGKSFTFHDTLKQATWFYNVLKSRGIKRGDIVVFFCSIHPCYTPALVATVSIGATMAPMNPEYSPDEMEHMLNIIQPNLILGNQKTINEVATVAENLIKKPELLVLEEMKEASDEEAGKLQVADDPSWLNDTAMIMCSSGTTGLPKGVELSHSALIACVDRYRVQTGEKPLMDTSQLTFLQTSPAFWGSGILFPLGAFQISFRTVAIPKFDVEMVLKVTEKYKTNFMFLSPSEATQLARSPLFKKYDTSSMFFAFVGGSPLNAEMETVLQETMDIATFQTYGITEAFLLATNKPPGGARAGSVGKPDVGVALKVIDVETGRILGANEEGELLFKSGTLMKGYLANPEATAEAIDQDGWFHTGDIGYYDDDKYIYVVDRIKELIKYKGNHVAPMTIESLLVTHPGVQQAVVVGVPHVLDMEHPRAFIVRRQDSDVAENELENMVKEKLPERYWLHGGVRFVDKVPMTPSGKVLRRVLRALS